MSDGVREVRGFVVKSSFDQYLAGEVSSFTLYRSSDYPRPSGVQPAARLILRLPEEPDGLPVGMMSNEGEILGHPHKTSEDVEWWQQASFSIERLKDLKPADPPETYAVVYDGEGNQGLDKDTAESLASMLKGRVVRSSELKGGA